MPAVSPHRWDLLSERWLQKSRVCQPLLHSTSASVVTVWPVAASVPDRSLSLIAGPMASRRLCILFSDEAGYRPVAFRLLCARRLNDTFLTLRTQNGGTRSENRSIPGFQTLPGPLVARGYESRDSLSSSQGFCGRSTDVQDPKDEVAGTGTHGSLKRGLMQPE